MITLVDSSEMSGLFPDQQTLFTFFSLDAIFAVHFLFLPPTNCLLLTSLKPEVGINSPSCWEPWASLALEGTEVSMALLVPWDGQAVSSQAGMGKQIRVLADLVFCSAEGCSMRFAQRHC